MHKPLHTGAKSVTGWNVLSNPILFEVKSDVTNICLPVERIERWIALDDGSFAPLPTEGVRCRLPVIKKKKIQKGVFGKATAVHPLSHHISVDAIDPTEHSSMPQACGGSPVNGNGGNGGCTAVALAKLGIFSSTTAATEALDAEIAPLHRKWLKLRGPCEDSEAGIRGEQWHDEAISNAIKTSKRWYVKRLRFDKQNPNAVSLKAVFKQRGRRFLVFGVTNNEWSKRSNGKIRAQPLKYPDCSADAPKISIDGWHHTVAICDGKLHDHTVKMALTAEHPLWIRDADNQPNRDLGWLRSIRKVWEILPIAGDQNKG